MPDIRPDLHGLSDHERILALAHWYAFLAFYHAERFALGAQHDWLQYLESQMQPETLHRLALARKRWWAQEPKGEKL